MTILRPLPDAPSELASARARWDDVCVLDSSWLSPEHRPDSRSSTWSVHVDYGTAAGSRSEPERTVTVPAAGLRPRMLDGSRPCRRFSWRAGQRHRPGLHYMASLDRHVGFESLEEQRLLLAVDFDGASEAVHGQPFALEFRHQGRAHRHVPDFLLRTGAGPVLVNVRPHDRLDDDSRVKFAACGALAELLGWRHEVVTGWAQPAMSVLDTLSASRRPMTDQLGVRGQMLDALRTRGPRRLADLVEATTCPAVARSHLLGLVWHRQASVDLARSLQDTTLIQPA